MGEFKKLKIKQYPAAAVLERPEVKFWKKFKYPVLEKEYGPVTSIDISPVAPYDFAVTSSTQIKIFDGNTHKANKSVQRFKDVVYSGRFRSDGKLLAAGGERPVVKLFDCASRTLLRTFKGHEKPVHVVRFGSSNVHLISGSDDKTIKYWDIGTATAVSTLAGHEDHVRCGMMSSGSTDVWVSGSYDHTVKLWDLRTGKAVMTLDHSSPVEDVLVFSGGGMLVSAGSNTMKIWDILGGGRLMQKISNHQKTITCMCFDGDQKRLLAGSLDHNLKIYDLSDYTVVHTIKYSAPILSLGLSPDNHNLVVGMSDSTLSIRHRVIKPEKEQKRKVQIRYKGGTYRYFMRGKTTPPAPGDLTIEAERRKKLRDYEHFLKKFQYRDALDAALKTAKAAIVVSMMYELSHRGGLKIALSNRDAITLEPLLTFLLKHMTDPRYSSLLIRVNHMLLDLYARTLSSTPAITDLFSKIQLKLNAEIELQKQLVQLLGSLDLLIAAATPGPPPAELAPPPSIPTAQTKTATPMDTQ